jgi:hypothetical protein
MMQPQSFGAHPRYYELIGMADKFVFLDDLQFSYQSWHHKAKFILNGQEKCVTLPIQEKFLPQNQTLVNYDSPNIEKIKRKIEENYKKCLYFEEYYPYLRYSLELPFRSLAQLNTCVILTVCNLLGDPFMKPQKFLFSSNLGVEGKKSEMVINLLEKIGADTYLSARGSYNYMAQEGIFPHPKIEVLFQNHECIPYKQQAPGFIPYISIFDALFNVGLDGTKELIYGTKNWETWEHIKEEN